MDPTLRESVKMRWVQTISRKDQWKGATSVVPQTAAKWMGL